MLMYFCFPMNQERSRNIIRYIKENGYITANIGEKKIINNFDRYKHKNIGMQCDSNYYDRRNSYPINKGDYFFFLRRFLNGKKVYKYIFEYAKDFWKKYKENRKFDRLSIIERHEMTAKVIKYLDKPLYLFLKRFIEEV